MKCKYLPVTMSPHRRSAPLKKLLCQSLALVVLACRGGAAADLATQHEQIDKNNNAAPPQAASDRTGFYISANAGVAGGRSSWSATQPGGAPLSGSLNFFQPIDIFDGSGSHFAGFGGGYNYQFR